LSRPKCPGGLPLEIPLALFLISVYHDVMKSKETKGSKPEKEDKDDRKSFPLRLPKATLKAMKLRALEDETSVQKILEGLIDAYLGGKTL